MLRRNIPGMLMLATAALLFGAIMMVPRIIEASKSSAATATQPTQSRDVDLTSLLASRFATTHRLLSAK